MLLNFFSILCKFVFSGVARFNLPDVNIVRCCTGALLFFVSMSASGNINLGGFKYTELSLNADGTILALGYFDKYKKSVIEILPIHPRSCGQSRRLKLGKIQAFTFAFGVDAKSLLITTIDAQIRQLLSVDVSDTENPKIQVLYSSIYLLRHPKEIGNGRGVVFLEQVNLDGGASLWRLLANGTVVDTASRIFYRGATVSVVGENVWLPGQRSGELISLLGSIPKEISEFYGDNHGYVSCGDNPNYLSCVMQEWTAVGATSYAKIVVNANGVICRVPVKWRSIHLLEVSGNGGYAVYQAMVNGVDKFNIYMINIKSGECAYELINFKKDV